MHTTLIQISGYVLCGKLKNAYLVAIRTKLVDEVRKISEIASKAGQLSVRDICEKWLQSNTSDRLVARTHTTLNTHTHVHTHTYTYAHTHTYTYAHIHTLHTH